MKRKPKKPTNWHHKYKRIHKRLKNKKVIKTWKIKKQ